MRLLQHRFRAWLKSKPPTEVVGRHRSPSCPIANFHSEVGGNDLVIFERYGDYYGDRGDGGRRLPWWAERFIAKVDGEQNGEITAGRALEILAQ